MSMADGTFTSPEESGPGLSSAPRAALRWSYVQQIGRVVPGYLGLVVLSRLLEPADFGIVGIAGVWLGILNALVGGGFGPSVVQSRALDRQALSSLASMTTILGVAAAVAGVLIAAPMCQVLRVPEATPYAQVSSLAFALAGLAVVPTAVAQRAMNFAALARRDIVSSIVSTLAAVAAALAGAGAWALVLQALTMTAVSAALIWHAQRRYVGLGRPSWSVMRQHAGYSGEVTAFQVVKAGLQTGHRAVVGAVLGPHALGLYMLGHKLSVETTAVVRAGLGGFLFPFLSRQQDDREALVVSFVRATRTLLGLTSLALAGGVLVAPHLVPLIFGEDWARAVVIAQVLTLVALGDCVFGTTGELMKATRHSRGLLIWSLAYAVVLIALLVVGALTAGLVGAAWGAGLAAILLVPMSLVQAGRRLRVSPMWLGRQVAAPVVGPAMVTVVALAVTALAPDVSSAVIVIAASAALLTLGLGQLRSMKSAPRT